MATTDSPRRRGLSPRGWLLIVVLSVVSLVAVLLGVALLARDSGSCSCSPIPPSRSPSAVSGT